MIYATKTELQVSGKDSEIYNQMNNALRAWYNLMRDNGSGELAAKRVIEMLIETAMYRAEDEYQEKKKG